MITRLRFCLSYDPLNANFNPSNGPDVLAVCRAHWGLPVGFFCSGIQFYLLLSPYLCFISLLYLDLYVLGDDALIS